MVLPFSEKHLITIAITSTPNFQSLFKRKTPHFTSGRLFMIFKLHVPY